MHFYYYKYNQSFYFPFVISMKIVVVKLDEANSLHCAGGFVFYVLQILDDNFFDKCRHLSHLYVVQSNNASYCPFFTGNKSHYSQIKNCCDFFSTIESILHLYSDSKKSPHLKNRKICIPNFKQK